MIGGDGEHSVSLERLSRAAATQLYRKGTLQREDSVAVVNVPAALFLRRPGAIEVLPEVSSKSFADGSSLMCCGIRNPSASISTRGSLGQITFGFPAPHDPRYGTKAVLEPEPREVCDDVST